MAPETPAQWPRGVFAAARRGSSDVSWLPDDQHWPVLPSLFFSQTCWACRMLGFIPQTQGTRHKDTKPLAEPPAVGSGPGVCGLLPAPSCLARLLGRVSQPCLPSRPLSTAIPSGPSRGAEPHASSSPWSPTLASPLRLLQLRLSLSLRSRGFACLRVPELWSRRLEHTPSYSPPRSQESAPSWRENRLVLESS